mgnify:CR=1 FL=1
MKVLLINGSPHAKGSTYTALHEMEKVFTENGIEAEIVHIGIRYPRLCCLRCLFQARKMCFFRYGK